MKKMICPNCQSNIPDDSVFCPNCGCNIKEIEKTIEAQKMLEEDAEKESVIISNVCPNCGKEFPSDSLFCPCCGCNIEDEYKKSEQNNSAIVPAENTTYKKPSSVWKVLTILLLALCIVLGVHSYNTSNETGIQKAEYEEYEKNIKSYKEDLEKYANATRKLNYSLSYLNNTIPELEKSVSFYTELYDIISKKNMGFSTENFHADKGIVFLKYNSKKATVKVKMAYENSTITATEIHGNNHITFEWSKKWDGNTIDLYITPKSRGISEIEISNNRYDNPFSIIVIVTN